MRGRITVISDVDDVLRRGKEPVAQEVGEAICEFRARGSRFLMITGAPKSHLPLYIPADAYFAETGAVWKREGRKWTYSKKAKEAIGALRASLGIAKEDGLDEIEEGTIIVEGIRSCSLTILFGHPPHYPSFEGTAQKEEVERRITQIISEDERLFSSIHRGSGVATIGERPYEWIDITVTTKALTVEKILQGCEHQEAYYLGDGRNDLDAMNLPGITPVGFRNSIPQIQELAQQRGIYIPLPAPPEGVVRFFDLLQQRGG